MQKACKHTLESNNDSKIHCGNKVSNYKYLNDNTTDEYSQAMGSTSEHHMPKEIKYFYPVSYATGWTSLYNMW